MRPRASTAIAAQEYATLIGRSKTEAQVLLRERFADAVLVDKGPRAEWRTSDGYVMIVDADGVVVRVRKIDRPQRRGSL